MKEIGRLGRVLFGIFEFKGGKEEILMYSDTPESLGRQLLEGASEPRRFPYQGMWEKKKASLAERLRFDGSIIRGVLTH